MGALESREGRRGSEEERLTAFNTIEAKKQTSKGAASGDANAEKSPRGRYRQREKKNAHTLQALIQLTTEIFSLDQLSQHQSDTSLKAIVSRKGGDSGQAEVDNNDLAEFLRKEMSVLSDRERRVLQLRYGLVEGGAVMTLEEVARDFGVTRERVRQIENRAESKMLERLKEQPNLVNWMLHQGVPKKPSRR